MNAERIIKTWLAEFGESVTCVEVADEDDGGHVADLVKRLDRARQPDPRRPTAQAEPGIDFQGAVNAMGNYKALFEQLCDQVAQMCRYLGAGDDAMHDSWTLRDLIIETKRKADEHGAPGRERATPEHDVKACPCCEAAGDLNVACVKYEKEIAAFRKVVERAQACVEAYVDGHAFHMVRTFPDRKLLDGLRIALEALPTDCASLESWLCPEPCRTRNPGSSDKCGYCDRPRGGACDDASADTADEARSGEPGTSGRSEASATQASSTSAPARAAGVEAPSASPTIGSKTQNTDGRGIPPVASSDADSSRAEDTCEHGYYTLDALLTASKIAREQEREACIAAAASVGASGTVLDAIRFREVKG